MLKHVVLHLYLSVWHFYEILLDRPGCAFMKSYSPLWDNTKWLKAFMSSWGSSLRRHLLRCSVTWLTCSLKLRAATYCLWQGKQHRLTWKGLQTWTWVLSLQTTISFKRYIFENDTFSWLPISYFWRTPLIEKKGASRWLYLWLHTFEHESSFRDAASEGNDIMSNCLRLCTNVFQTFF